MRLRAIDDMVRLLRVEKVLHLDDERTQGDGHHARLDARGGEVRYDVYVTHVDGRPQPLAARHT